MDYKLVFTSISIVCGFLSAFAWLYASRVKVSDKKAVALLEKRAKKNKEKPNYARMTFDGADIRETWRAQTKWNSLGAIFASISMSFQVILQIFFE
ncbi:hypothetical protein EA756_04145 [Acinetobacter lactucae]|uniref:Uncharacterized protein n=1 Tax=Acinetobacter lactucae TaxID=1785128 RepID=A0A429K6T9_9GAMM|nr:hypothetical protein [Acinetobacter lactucae]RSO59637.1 hypothetical protein EA756_04145 [Acinetobacter lactucae]